MFIAKHGRLISVNRDTNSDLYYVKAGDGSAFAVVWGTGELEHSTLPVANLMHLLAHQLEEAKCPPFLVAAVASGALALDAHHVDADQLACIMSLMDKAAQTRPENVKIQSATNSFNALLALMAQHKKHTEQSQPPSTMPPIKPLTPPGEDEIPPSRYFSA